MYKHKQSAFTIVELLIVVVVIAILAAITIVAYNGITRTAGESAAKAELSQIAKKLASHKVVNGTYPASDTSAALSAIGIDNISDDNIYDYVSDGNSFCINLTRGNLVNHASSDSPSPRDGLCDTTNLTLNPSLESNTTDWSSHSGGGTSTKTRETSGGKSGSGFYRIRWTSAQTTSGGGCYTDSAVGQVAAGSPYTASMHIRSSKNQILQMSMEWKGEDSSRTGSTRYGSPVSVTAGVWTRLSVTGVAPENTHRVTTPVYTSANGPNWQTGDYLDCDAAMFTKGTTPYPYADGNSPGWSWNGVVNNSTSTGPAL